ncbi:hypothetical protein [Dokdonia sp. PRO95]|uniref:hypothetical protein n=1 Tax=Dokdonia sp. PRO95 TaxID=1239415 RepID=UPI000A864A60|nr:hypothetical protein [Dokdonia sp. PRO95]
MKLIICFLIMFSVCNITYGQDYGVYFETKDSNTFAFGDNPITSSTTTTLSVSGGTSTSYTGPPAAFPQGSTFHNSYLPIPNNISAGGSGTVTIESWYANDGGGTGGGDCDFGDEFTTTISNFLLNSFQLEGCQVVTDAYLIHIQEPSAGQSTVCLDEELTLSVGRYWQYKLNSGPWTNFPNAYNNTDEPSFIISDLTGSNETGIIKFRTGYDGQYANTVTYTIAPETPSIQSLVRNNTSCDYNSDGSFTLNFNTNLSGEQIEFNLKKGSINGPLLTETANITGNTYSWPDTLAPDIYYLTYQAFPNGCAKTYNGITIGSPPPLEYFIEATDISCFNENNGEINITINPNNNGSIGTPPYNYVLGNGNTGTFSGAGTTISGLSAGSTTIQVFDSNACTERL